MTEESGRAPWTSDQVDNLKIWQTSGQFHPYTCGNRGDGQHTTREGDLGQLIPTTEGWICADCDYTQDWAMPGSLAPPTVFECETCGTGHLNLLSAMGCCS